VPCAVAISGAMATLISLVSVDFTILAGLPALLLLVRSAPAISPPGVPPASTRWFLFVMNSERYLRDSCFLTTS